MDTQERIDHIKKFIEREYLAEITDNFRKDKFYIDIDWAELAKYDPDIADRVLDMFEDTKKEFELAIEQFDLESKACFDVRFYNLTKTVDRDIWRLRAKDLCHFITLKGFLRRVGDVQHAIKAAKFECPACGNVINVLMLDDRYKTPKRCGCGRKGNFHLLSKELSDVQKVVLEEDPALAKTPDGKPKKPRSIVIRLEDSLCRAEIDASLQPSKKVAICGLVQDLQVKPYLVECRKFIKANSIQLIDESIERIEITVEDIKKFKEMAKSKTLYEDLAQSIVPNIEGHLSAKIAIVLQLMGGVALYIDDQLEERGPIHILLVGSPGQGKSVMLKRAVLFMPGSRFTGGKGASGVGLVAAVTKDEEFGGYVLDAGAVAMSSGSMCAIDELDKMSKSDRSHMNNAMVDMKVSIDKATIHATLETETMILGAANPKDRVFDPHELIWKQIGLTKDFLDRFDLTFPIQAAVKEEDKRRVANLVVGKYRADSKYAKPIYPKDLVIKYIAYARKTVKPEMTTEVQDYIVDNFINIVKPADKEEDAAYFSYRLLTNIVRLTQAVAKTRLADKPSVEDSQRAINILLDSLKAQEIITPDGFDYERGEAIVPKKKRDRYKIIKGIIKEKQEASKSNEATYDEIAQLAEQMKIDPDDLDEALEKLKFTGDIMEVRRQRYQLL